MKKLLSTAIVALAAMTFSSTANAQAESLVGPYIGVQGGFQELATIDLATISGAGDELNIDGGTFGIYAGYNAAVSENVILGFEGSASLGTNSIDSDFAVSAHAGIATGNNSMIFARAGYQFFNVSVVDIAEDFLGRPVTAAERVILDGQDELADGIMIGGGAQFGLSDNIALRATENRYCGI